MRIEIKELGLPDPITEERDIVTRTGELIDVTRGILNTYVIWKDDRGYLHETNISEVRIISELTREELNNVF